MVGFQIQSLFSRHRKKTGDYHTNMNWENFSKWFQEKLLKNIPKNPIILMNNAPYHNDWLKDDKKGSDS